MNILEDYTNIIDKFKKLVVNNTTYYSMDSLFYPEASIDNFFKDIQSNIPNVEYFYHYTKSVMLIEMDTISLLKILIPLKSCHTDHLKNMITTSFANKVKVENVSLLDFVSFRDEVFNMSEEEYLMWRMSI